MQYIESFIFGIIAALGALIVELFVFIIISFFDSSTAISFSELFTVPYFIIATVCIEEILKYLFILKRIEALEDRGSFFTNSLTIGLGFLGVEFAFLLANGSGLSNAQFLLEIATVHVGTAGIMGYLGIFWDLKKLPVFGTVIFLAVLFHGSYNFLALEREKIGNSLVFIVLGVLILANIKGFLRIKDKLARD